jgi:hypothetical protein
VEKKTRISIPRDVAAQVLFWSDRTCCVCREPRKDVQIHHIDETPSNNDLENLCVLCFDCHNETQLRGGFGRRLDQETIRLFRVDWLQIVRQRRAAEEARRVFEREGQNLAIQEATELAEIYRERKEFFLLVVHYDSLGQTELRDKYIDRILSRKPDDDLICFLRGLQGRPDRIPREVVEREIDRLTKSGDYQGRARLYVKLGRYKEAASDYVRGIAHSLENGRIFAAAFYLKEAVIEERLAEHLFREAFEESKRENDLWWQVRALEELNASQELSALLLSKADEIRRSGDLVLMRKLALASGEEEVAFKLSKDIAKNTRLFRVPAKKKDPNPDT